MGFPGGSVAKNLPANARDMCSIPRSGRCPQRRQPSPVFLPGNFHGPRSLASYSPWGEKRIWQSIVHGAAKESDTT